MISQLGPGNSSGGSGPDAVLDSLTTATISSPTAVRFLVGGSSTAGAVIQTTGLSIGNRTISMGPGAADAAQDVVFTRAGPGYVFLGSGQGANATHNGILSLAGIVAQNNATLGPTNIYGNLSVIDGGALQVDGYFQTDQGYIYSDGAGNLTVNALAIQNDVAANGNMYLDGDANCTNVNAAGNLSFQGGLIPNQYSTPTLASLDLATNQGQIDFISDPASGKLPIVVAYQNSWYYLDFSIARDDTAAIEAADG